MRWERDAWSFFSHGDPAGTDEAMILMRQIAPSVFPGHNKSTKICEE
ncbi:MAG: hypothetical protein IT167_19705 [Bryobacterales bacterium]|nr:hypothetical protein [Bryobacterales bacterium]